MCGIIGGVKKKKLDLAAFAVDQFQDQRARGTRGFGLLTQVRGAKPVLKQATCEIKALLDLYQPEAHTADLLLFHHRTPTSSENLLSQTHPFAIRHKELGYTYHVVHNGVIGNCSDLYHKHKALGYRYRSDLTARADKYLTFNDSESVAVEFARYLDGATKKIHATGSYALVAFREDKQTHAIDKVYMLAHNNPLSIVHDKDGLRFASELRGTALKADRLYVYDIAKDKLTHKAADLAPEPKVKPYTWAGLAPTDDNPIISSIYDIKQSDDKYDENGTRDATSDVPADSLSDDLETLREQAADAVDSYMDELRLADGPLSADVDATTGEVRKALVEARDLLLTAKPTI